MDKPPPPPLLGFNNNVRHQGRIFHIQTEDSGVKHSRIVTHLFADGGRIVKTSRTEYAEHLGREDLVPVVRRLMKDQHKAMFIALRAGELNELIEGMQEEKASKVEAAPPPPKERPPESRLSNPNLRKVIPSVPPPSAAELDAIDVGRLEPLKEIPRDRLPAHVDPNRPPPARRGTPIQGTPPELARSSETQRYGSTRPAAIFESDEDSPGRRSIFGESVISEKSLDEVILSYLAEDLDESSSE